MRKGLVKEIGKKVLPFVFGGLSLINSGCAKNYQIDGNNVKYSPWKPRSIVETVGNAKIRYSLESDRKGIIRYSLESDRKGIKRVYILGEKYTKRDTLVLEAANTHYNYLREKIDSIENAMKLQEEQDRIARAMRYFD